MSKVLPITVDVNGFRKTIYGCPWKDAFAKGAVRTSVRDILIVGVVRVHVDKGGPFRSWAFDRDRFSSEVVLSA